MLQRHYQDADFQFSLFVLVLHFFKCIAISYTLHSMGGRGGVGGLRVCGGGGVKYY